jgi:hypothetical protein
MTPEELNRTMEFIVASQAQINASQERINTSLDRLAAAQEEDRRESKAAIARHEKMLTRLADLEAQQADLLINQSERMDRLDTAHADWSRQIVHLLNMILDRLPPLIH